MQVAGLTEECGEHGNYGQQIPDHQAAGIAHVDRGWGEIETQETEQTESAKSVSSDKDQKLKEDLDQLIDQIDEVLEENAEEFVRNYVQRGGQ